MTPLLATFLKRSLQLFHESGSASFYVLPRLILGLVRQQVYGSDFSTIVMLRVRSLRRPSGARTCGRIGPLTERYRREHPGCLHEGGLS